MWSHVLQAWLSVVLGHVQHVIAEKKGKQIRLGVELGYRLD